VNEVKLFLFGLVTCTALLILSAGYNLYVYMQIGTPKIECKQ